MQVFRWIRDAKSLSKLPIEELARYSGLAELEITREHWPLGPDPDRKRQRADRRSADDLRELLDCPTASVRALRRLVIRAGMLATSWPSWPHAVLYAGAAAVHPAFRSGTRHCCCSRWRSRPASLPVRCSNAAVTRLIAPQALPALDLGGAVPDSARTLVVIPVLLTTVPEVREIAGALENHFLASARGELYFALLADGTDADAAVIPTMPRSSLQGSKA